MRRFAVPVLAIFAVLAALGLVVVDTPQARTQEASPSAATPAACPTEAPDPEATPHGAFADVLVGDILSSVEPCSFVLVKWVLAPQGTVPIHPYPPALIYVESGAVTITLQEGVVWHWVDNDENQAAPISVAPGTDAEEITLDEGDSAFVENAEYGVMNPSDNRPAVLFVSTVKRRESGCPPNCWTWP